MTEEELEEMTAKTMEATHKALAQTPRIAALQAVCTQILGTNVSAEFILDRAETYLKWIEES